METTRRNFLGGALALSVAAVVPLPAFANVPAIYGDGIHDDWAGLQALLDGEPFIVDGGHFVASEGLIANGVFRVTQTLTIRTDHFRLSNCHFKAIFPGGAPILEIQGFGTTVADCVFTRAGVRFT